jgi:hypothetical protein
MALFDRLWYLSVEAWFGWDRVIQLLGRVKGNDSREALGPQMLASLETDVLPSFRGYVDESGHGRHKDHGFEEPFVDGLSTSAQTSPSAARLQQSLEAWSRKWHLPARGFQVIALQTMHAWLHQAEVAGRTWHYQPWCFPPPGSQPPRPRRFDEVTFPVGDWDLERETRGEAKERMRREFEEDLDRYLDRKEGVELSDGLMSRTRVKAEEHFEWFIRFQVNGERFAQLAEAVGVDRRAVAREIDEVGEILDRTGWKSWRRERSRGRPPKGERPG